ncbi:unnamed protein product [Pleuronectes platessa]|uniref:Uncharacterized protein n=1 Tax=Pleuronectes platessa TaxID=8262 RepID=A0A9N7VDU6_PLEPL|nr:unnamed protein product [Pleuronectes platessa]
MSSQASERCIPDPPHGIIEGWYAATLFDFLSTWFQFIMALVAMCVNKVKGVVPIDVCVNVGVLPAKARSSLGMYVCRCVRVDGLPYSFVIGALREEGRHAADSHPTVGKMENKRCGGWVGVCVGTGGSHTGDRGPWSFTEATASLSGSIHSIAICSPTRSGPNHNVALSSPSRSPPPTFGSIVFPGIELAHQQTLNSSLMSPPPPGISLSLSLSGSELHPNAQYQQCQPGLHRPGSFGTVSPGRGRSGLAGELALAGKPRIQAVSPRSRGSVHHLFGA